MPEASMQHCAAEESPLARVLRYTAAGLLVLIALVECAVACLMLAVQRSAPQMMYLLCSASLFAAAVIAARERRRALTAVRMFAIATAVMLFWSISTDSEPSVSFRGHLHDLGPALAVMLLGAVLLPRLLEPSSSEAACKCG